MAIEFAIEDRRIGDNTHVVAVTGEGHAKLGGSGTTTTGGGGAEGGVGAVGVADLQP